MEERYRYELRNFLDEDGKLRQLPAKQKMREPIYEYFASFFEKGRKYTEVEVNEILNGLHTFRDAAFFRRMLYQLDYLDRKKDCSEYWVNDKGEDEQ